MIVNLEFDAQALAAPQSFRNGMQAAANILDADFSNAITVNITVGYGEYLGGALPNQNTSEGNVDYNGVNGADFSGTYQTIRTLMLNSATSADDATAYANDLPNVTDLQGHAVNSWHVSSALVKAWGLLAPNNPLLDGAVGMGTNFTGNVLLGGALHELTHAMGRIAGENLDMFRFNENMSGNRVYGGAVPAPAGAYFSIDGGATKLADFGINSDPGDFLNTGIQGPDPFNETIGGSSMTAADLTLMDVLGFTRSAASFQGPNGVPNPDFNGDHKADLLWQNDDGEVWQSLMSGSQVIASNDLGNGGNPAWHVVATGDFTGSGKSGLLWQNDDGHVWETQLNGNQIVNSLDLGNAGNPAWHVVTAADMNGDGKSDIIWQNDDGHVWESQMNGGSVINSLDLGNAGETAWHVVATGDFNGDGKGDLLWQNDDGHVWITELNGGNGIVNSIDMGNAGNPAWHVVTTGDFNGDGKSDILWQNDDGHVWITELNGGSTVNSIDMGNAGNPAWHVVRAGDFNGDGHSDILWQNDDGQVWQTLLVANQVIGSNDLGNAGDPSWHILPAHS
ncbi:MAG: NF038122 family metalloprotease [Hyphomicrobiales bacterium]